MKKRRRWFWSKCRSLSKLSLLLVVLFTLSSFRNQDQLHVEFPLSDKVPVQQTREELTRTEVSLAPWKQPSYSVGKKTIPSGKSDDEDDGEYRTNSELPSLSKGQASTESSCLPGVNDRGEEAQFSIWIPQSPDLSIPRRLEESIRGLSPGGNPDLDVVNELCPLPTSQVKIIAKCSYWVLQALDAHGNPKTVGGDEFYVTYHHGLHADNTSLHRHPPTAVAKIQDLFNGTYRLDFVESPFRAHQNVARHSTNGIIQVTFQYTCGIGAIHPPSKAGWRSSGAIAVAHSHPVNLLPPRERFLSPLVISNVGESPNGSNPKRVFLDWMDDEMEDAPSIRMTNETAIDKRYREPVILAFGDSLMQQFVESWKQTKIPNVGMPLNTTTVDDWIKGLEKRLGPKIKSLTTGSKAASRNVALIVGSSTWDLLEPQESSGSTSGWDDHASAMETLIDFIQQKFLSQSKNLRLFWKSPTAMHIHIPILENNLQGKGGEELNSKLHNRIKYMSSSRSFELHKVQKQVCAKLRVPYLDVYELSHLAAHRTQIGDGRHFDQVFNRHALQSFFKHNMVDHFWLRYQWKVFVSKESSPNRILSIRYCPDSWVDVIQAVVLASVTNRQMELDPQESCNNWRIYVPFLSRAGLLKARSNNSGSRKQNVATLGERLPFPLSLDVLVQQGWIPNSIGSPSYQVATEAFEKGTSYLYGMIWNYVLSKSLTLHKDDQETGETNHSASDMIFVAVHDVTAVGQGGISKCMSELLQPSAHMGCKVLFSSEQGIKAWQGILGNNFNCTSELLPSAFVQEEYNRQTDADVSILWNLAIEIGKMAKDGYISGCKDGKDTLFNALVDYIIRKEEAKTRGLEMINQINCCI